MIGMITINDAVLAHGLAPHARLFRFPIAVLAALQYMHGGYRVENASHPRELINIGYRTAALPKQPVGGVLLLVFATQQGASRVGGQGKRAGPGSDRRRSLQSR